jgi:multidrug transporter EmrE-like cation transporter
MAVVFLAVPLAAHLVLGEALPPARIVSIALIISGIVLVAATA